MFSFQQELIELEEKGLRRSLSRGVWPYAPTVQSPQDNWLSIDSKKVLNLCSNNYLGLANDPRIKEAAIQAIRNYGFGSGASRLVCGNSKLYKILEEKLAEFKKTESSLVFNSGYTANLGIISALVKKGDIIFSDKLNHASIIDAIILSRAEFKRYPHKDVEALEKILSNQPAPAKRSGPGKPATSPPRQSEAGRGNQKRLIVTDSVFSMDGDIAPLEGLINLSKKYNCLLMIDEAHATGVLGKNGRGALEYLELENKKDGIIQMGTLSKAFGGFGAYVCGAKDLIDYLLNFSRSFIYTTALPPAVLAANIKAIEIIQNEPERRIKLRNNVEFFRDKLIKLGFKILGDVTPIIPLITKEPKLTINFSKRLFEEGVFAQGIRPPTVPQGQARLRITLMSTHTIKDLEFALGKIEKIGKELQII